MTRYAVSWKRHGVPNIIDFDGDPDQAFEAAVSMAVGIAEAPEKPCRTDIVVFVGQLPEPDPDVLALHAERLLRVGAHLELMTAIRQAANQ